MPTAACSPRPNQCGAAAAARWSSFLGSQAGVARARAAPARLALVAGAAGLLGVLNLTGCGSSDRGAARVARVFLARWSHSDYRAAAASTNTAPEKVVAEFHRFVSDLDLKRGSFSLRGLHASGNTASADFRAALELRGLGLWRYDGQLRLSRARGRWRVVWKPAVLYPRLRPGERLVAVRRLPPRAPILDREGRPLIVPTPVVTVGVVPKLLTSRRQTLRVLRRTVGVDPARVRSLIAASAPDQFIPVITLRRRDYERVRAVIHPLPGVHFQTGTRPLAPTREFARLLLGVVGPATADALKLAGPAYTATDQIGLSGLEQLYQRRLAGTASGAVLLLGPKRRRLAKLFSVHGSPGKPARTTLDRRVQAAAESALEHVVKPAALVAVQASTGEILAAANRPADSFDRAFLGLYPPGSSFKVVTAEALLSDGFDPEAKVPCPPTVVVGGKRFTNFEGEALGLVPFRLDFARSCNTAFVGLARRVTARELGAAARLLGIGARYGLPLPSTSGRVPPPQTAAEHAAELIGQGRVVVSPLAMALVAGAVASGAWHPPMLVTTPAPSRPMAAPKSLRPSIANALRRLMRAVVVEGTGTEANLPGSPVYGKTGTAEFGTGAHAHTHAWFIGFRGDTAFAVLVEGGGIGGRVAAPIAATFLRALE